MTQIQLPYYFPGSKTGCLLLHGFTGTPGELRLIGEALHAEGYTVQGILLAGHGTKPEDLLAVTYQDWIESAQQGLNNLKKHCQKVVVIGHSLGGLLALQMAARNKINGLVTIAAAAQMSDRKTHLARFLKYFRKFVAVPEKDWPPEQKKYLFRYTYFPVAAVAQLQRLATHTLGILPQITTDALIIQTRDDETVRPASANLILKDISSQRKECFWLAKGTHHVPVIPPYNGQIIAKIISFIQNL